MITELSEGMVTINDVCLHNIQYVNFGNDIAINIGSTFDGRSIYKICCQRVMNFETKRYWVDDDFFGDYVALIVISSANNGSVEFITLESGAFFIRLECQNITCEEV